MNLCCGLGQDRVLYYLLEVSYLQWLMEIYIDTNYRLSKCLLHRQLNENA